MVSGHAKDEQEDNGVASSVLENLVTKNDLIQELDMKGSKIVVQNC